MNIYLHRSTVLLILGITFGVLGCSPTNGKAGKEFAQARKSLFAGNYDTAVKGFEDFLQTHPSHDLSVRATFLLGKCHLGSGDHEEASRWFQRTVDRYGDSEEANKAKYKMAMIAYLDGDLVDAKERLHQVAEQANGPYTPEASAWIKYLDALPVGQANDLLGESPAGEIDVEFGAEGR